MPIYNFSSLNFTALKDGVFFFLIDFSVSDGSKKKWLIWVPDQPELILLFTNENQIMLEYIEQNFLGILNIP